MKGNGSRPGPRSRVRRTQGERSAATRAKVVEAATECVAELGYRGATMSVMAQRAGVSWGAMQHQFGEKDAIFDAVLERVMAQLEGNFRGLREGHPEPVDRIRAFVQRNREIAGGPIYRAFVEIQLHRGRAGGDAARVWANYVGDVIADVWRNLFSDLGLSRRRLEDAQRFTFVVLSGIAAEAMLFPDVDFSARHFDILEETLLRLLDQEG
ncbi:MAG: TetR/AcrR family transcriptional regulator [Myxococcota bacterium]